MKFLQRLARLDDVGKDVRYGLRMLLRSPAFTAVSLLTLALGIGVNTAIFSIVNGAILRPLGYPHPEQLMRLTAGYPVGSVQGFRLSTPEYLEFRAMNKSFREVGAAARHCRRHAAGLRRDGQPDGNLAADRRPPGDSPDSG
jgi:hypothetical protein